MTSGMIGQTTNVNRQSGRKIVNPISIDHADYRPQNRSYFSMPRNVLYIRRSHSHLKAWMGWIALVMICLGLLKTFGVL
jgi:hypothetical protein